MEHRYQPHLWAPVLKKITVESHFNKPLDKIGYTELNTVHFSGAAIYGGHYLTWGKVEINTAWADYRTSGNQAYSWTE